VLTRTLSMWTGDGIVSLDFNAKSVSVLSASPAVRSGAFSATKVPPADRMAMKDRFFADTLPFETLVVADANAIAAEHDDFLDAIRTGRQPLVTAAAGASALEIAARVLEAAECVSFAGGRPTVAATATIPLAPRRKTG